MSAAAVTTCPYCGVGCGVAARRTDERALDIAGDAAHPANAGRLCSKGTALGSTVSLKGRLLHPQIDGRRVGWDNAIAHVAARLSETIAHYGPQAVAFYVSGQLLTEDYYAANKLMKGFIGAANIDTNSRLCMSSAVAAHKHAFGADLVPTCYEDLDLADLVVFAGHNAAWTHPVLYRRMEDAKRVRGQRHVVIDPRRTETAEDADIFLPLAPQTDVRLWNGLLAFLIARGAVDRAFVAAHVVGFSKVARALVQDDQSLGAIARDCGLAEADLLSFYLTFAGMDRTVSLFSMGVNQSAQGVNKALAIVNAHLATGRIGKPGAGPFSITGQPNAMGGRETGGLATALAAHMDFDAASRERLARFWNTDRVAQAPGLKAVDLFDAVGDGRIKALWIMATNPVVSMPDSSAVSAALAKCPLVIVSECMAETDTTKFANVLLPALAWGERDGAVTNSERRISRQRPLFAPPGEARADWRIVADVAGAMGFGEAFTWRRSADVFREYAALTAFENDGERMLDLGPLAHLDDAAYDALAPIQWPVRAQGGTARLFEDGRFAHRDGRARMSVLPAEGPAARCDADYPFALNTGRIRDQWHTMTRTGLAPELCRHTPEPRLAVHPHDAASLALSEGALARVESRHGASVFAVEISGRQRRGDVFVPIHWTAAFAPCGMSNRLIADHRDPVSGQPEFKHAPVKIEPFGETWRAFVIDRRGLSLNLRGVVWRRIPHDGCELFELAGAKHADPQAFLDAVAMEVDTISAEDSARGLLRCAYLVGGRLERVVMLAHAGGLPSREWIIECFAAETLGERERAAILVGRMPGFVDRGATICACASVREATITEAIANGALDLDALGAATRAGVTCGSCRPELSRMLARLPARQEEKADD